MKRRRIRTVEDLLNTPEGEWFYDPEGRDLESIDDTTDGIDSVKVPLSKSTAARLGLRSGERFTAKYSRGVLTLTRPRRRTVRRHE